MNCILKYQKEFNTFNEETTRVTQKKGLFGDTNREGWEKAGVQKSWNLTCEVKIPILEIMHTVPVLRHLRMGK
jgi:hypothetical protein